MTHFKKTLQNILSGVSDNNIPFDQMRHLLQTLGFNEKIKGDHHIFSKENVEEILKLQPKGGKCKLYQVKQVRRVIHKYALGDN